MKKILNLTALGVLLFSFVGRVPAQSLGNAGTVDGSVVDPSGAAVAQAAVTIHNAITGYNQSTTTAADGSFRLINIPPNPYHLEIMAPGFNVFGQDVTVRSALPSIPSAACPSALAYNQNM